MLQVQQSDICNEAVQRLQMGANFARIAVRQLLRNDELYLRALHFPEL